MMLITGHRGAAKLEPENTLLAMRKALDLKVDQIELDVHLTRDAHLIVMHDETVDRTTNGHGAIAQMTLQEVRALDAGKGERVPTLQEVIDLVRGKAILQIELKGAETEEPTVRAVEQNQIVDQVLLTSFVHDRLRRVRQLNPRIRIAALWFEAPPDACEQAVAMGAEALHVHYEHLDAALVQSAHAGGLQIRAWNPDTIAEIQRVIDLGVDGIGSNRPDLLVQLCRT